MTSFPLYDSLNKELSSKDLQKAHLKTLVAKINSDTIDPHIYELIYMLIRTCSDNDTQEKKSLIPYNGVRKGTDIEFQLDKLPPNLIKILYKFVSNLDKTDTETKESKN